MGMGLSMEDYENSVRPERFISNCYNFWEKLELIHFLGVENSFRTAVSFSIQLWVGSMIHCYFQSIFLRAKVGCGLQSSNIISQRNSGTTSLSINNCAYSLKGLPQTHFDQWEDHLCSQWGYIIPCIDRTWENTDSSIYLQCSQWYLCFCMAQYWFTEWQNHQIKCFCSL